MPRDRLGELAHQGPGLPAPAAALLDSIGATTPAGPAAVRTIAATVAELASGLPHRPRVLLIVGPGFGGRPWAQRVLDAVEPLDARVEVHRGTITPESVARMAGLLRAERVNVAVAVGGGTVLDAAKASAALAGRDGVDSAVVVDACLGTVARPPSPVRVVAVPTTAGTGAEATPFATVWDQQAGRKLSLAGPDVRPAAAVLDPDLLDGLGTAELARGLLDTLCQGAEASWSIRSSSAAGAWGMAAVALAAPLMGRLARSGLDQRERMALHYAGHCSGRAIALAQTSSCHAVSYPLTLWLGLPHGHACGVSLGRMLRHNAAVTAADCAHPRGPRWVRRTIHRITRELGGEPAAAAARVEGFLEACGLRRYDELEVDHRAVAAEALSYPRCHDNPRRLGDDSLSQLLATPAERGSPCGSTRSSWPTG